MKFLREISVTYTDGVLRPDERLDLPEGARLRAIIRPEPTDPAARERALDEIRRISESGAFRSGGRKLTREQVYQRG